VLAICAADLEAVVAHCRAGLPHEACGLLGGRAGAVESVHPVRNARPGRCSFAMEPGDQLRAMERIREAGGEIVALFHSHPEGPAAPSRFDLEDSCWPGTAEPGYPGVLHVIVSLRDPGAPEVKAYALVGGAFSEVPIVVSGLRSS
jgi:proteasome lid subunit RPN8/RPN11